MTTNRSFLGTGWSFPPEFVKGKYGVKMISNEDDICSSLHLLLSTAKGERLMQPTYGCNLHQYVFEPLNATLRAEIKDLVRDAILYFEPRITLNNVTLETEDTEGRVVINVDYTIISTNTRRNLVYPFYLIEGTDVNT